MSNETPKILPEDIDNLMIELSDGRQVWLQSELLEKINQPGVSPQKIRDDAGVIRGRDYAVWTNKADLKRLQSAAGKPRVGRLHRRAVWYRSGVEKVAPHATRRAVCAAEGQLALSVGFGEWCDLLSKTRRGPDDTLTPLHSATWRNVFNDLSEACKGTVVLPEGERDVVNWLCDDLAAWDHVARYAFAYVLVESGRVSVQEIQDAKLTIRDFSADISSPSNALLSQTRFVNSDVKFRTDAREVDFFRGRMDACFVWDSVITAADVHIHNARASRFARCRIESLRRAFGCQIIRSSLVGADLIGGRWLGVYADHGCFDRASLRGTELDRVRARYASFLRTKMQHVTVARSDFDSSDFSLTRWLGSSVQSSSLARCNFEGAMLDVRRWQHVNIAESTFKHATIMLGEATGLDGVKEGAFAECSDIDISEVKSPEVAARFGEACAGGDEMDLKTNFGPHAWGSPVWVAFNKAAGTASWAYYK